MATTPSQEPAAPGSEDGRFPQLPAPLSLPEIEREIVEFWKADGTFEASVEQRPEDSEYVFYDGPPFANGLPHYGHLLTGFVKDVIPRFQTMAGRRVERRFGWDTHGLPAELAAEEMVGISGRKEIIKFGVAKFNDACRESVLKFTGEWEEYVTRQARWVDFEDSYKTLDRDYMESCLWAFKQLHDRGFVYKGYRVVPYSWAVQSPLSNFETRLDDSYRSRTDPAVTVALPLREPLAGHADAHLLIWTTTPWTLPSNLAVAVGADIDYAIMKADGKCYVLSVNARAKYDRQFADAELVGTISGSELAGALYEPLFPYFRDQPNAFRVLAADFVDDADGTGLVHMAPGFGEDDLEACRAAGIEVVVPVDEAGRFTEPVSDYAGMQVFEANAPIIARLKDEGLLVRHDTIDHNYPHCWRTDEPLIYRAVESWYLEVSAFREQMAAHNRKVNWIPGHVRDGLFGNWLENAADWNISRSRFWGTPIPVWMSDDPDHPRIDVYGSIAELERDFGVEVRDLHRPFIDQLTRPNPDDPTGRSTMRRVEDVFDCWFESGAMPFASIHYPFENKEWFEDHFPADFIVEYVAQTRGWFYTLVVLGVMLFDSPPFMNAICHGVVLDENRQKLSKRLRNYPDPLEFFDEYGADTMRWFLVSSTVLSGGDIVIPRLAKTIAQTRREAISPLLNAYSFFTLYANLEDFAPQLVNTADHPLDRYILVKLGELADRAGDSLSRYDIPGACRVTAQFMEVLTNWYIRRSRDRFWEESYSKSKHDAFNTLYTVLVRCCEIAAPLLPILTEKLYRGLVDTRSVHLAEWPRPEAFPDDHALAREMDLVREACSAGLNVRERFRLRVRLPLKRAVIAHPDADTLRPHAATIADELNVRELEFSTDLSSFGSLQLKVDPRIGKRLGHKMKDVLAAARANDYELLEDGGAVVSGETLSAQEFELQVICGNDGEAASFGRTGAIIVDISVDREQEQEGTARDLVRLIQNVRKDAGLEVSDRIALGIDGSAETLEAARKHADLIASQTLAVDLEFAAGDGASSHDLRGETVTLSVRRADSGAAA